MTALPPQENRRVRAVASERYPLNEISGHPDSTEPAVDPHHIFPRSAIGGDSWFVEITDEVVETEEGHAITTHDVVRIIPHVIGLSREEHERVERHESWIKLEGDGTFVWYDRVAPTDPFDELPPEWEEWVAVGPLNPQPGSREGKPKRKRTLKGTAERASRKTVSVRLPEGVSGEDWDELLEQASEIELQQPDTQFDPAKGAVTVGKLLVTLLERFTGRAT